MIPKIIHYCWFGGNPLPELAQRCIASWKKYCPDYEIKKWDESNFDVDCCDYVKEAYNAKKWAFVSDVARFKVLYDHGGLYFDTDVELIASIHDIVEKGPFMGFEKCEMNFVAPGLGLGVYPGHKLYKEVLDFYMEQHFIACDGTFNQTTVVAYLTEILRKYGLKNDSEIQNVDGIFIYPHDYFCPLNYYTGVLDITDNTKSIHHYTTSWYNEKEKKYLDFGRKMRKKFGIKIGNYFEAAYSFPYRIAKKIKEKGVLGAIKFAGEKLFGNR